MILEKHHISFLRFISVSKKAATRYRTFLFEELMCTRLHNSPRCKSIPHEDLLQSCRTSTDAFFFRYKHQLLADSVIMRCLLRIKGQTSVPCLSIWAKRATFQVPRIRYMYLSFTWKNFTSQLSLDMTRRDVSFMYAFLVFFKQKGFEELA